MYKKIILLFGLILAVAEGNLDEGKTNISDVGSARTEEIIKLEQQRYSKILQNYTTKLNNSRNDFYKVINELNENLLKMPEINEDQTGECPTKYEDIIKICSSKIERYCKSVFTVCQNETKVQEKKLWGFVTETINNFAGIQKNFEMNIANCRKTFGISTSKYHECIAELITLENDYIRQNNEQINNYLKFYEEYVTDLRKSAVNFLGKKYVTKTCTSSSVNINNKWYPIYEKDCQISNLN